jgi:arginine/ornithine N-succinyltransferase beta subunit
MTLPHDGTLCDTFVESSLANLTKQTSIIFEGYIFTILDLQRGEMSGIRQISLEEMYSQIFMSFVVCKLLSSSLQYISPSNIFSWLKWGQAHGGNTELSEV